MAPAGRETAVGVGDVKAASAAAASGVVSSVPHANMDSAVETRVAATDTVATCALAIAVITPCGIAALHCGGLVFTQFAVPSSTLPRSQVALGGLHVAG